MDTPSLFDRLGMILRRTAAARRTIAERDVMAELGWNDHGLERQMQLAFLLTSLSYIQRKSQHVPMLAAIVLSEETGRPSRDFFETARKLGARGSEVDEDRFWMQELARVYGFWGTGSESTTTARTVKRRA